MIVAAALCPGPPLLLPGLTGASAVQESLRSACAAATAELTLAAPDVIDVIAAGQDSRTWSADSQLDVTVFAPGPAGPPSPPGGRSSRDLPTGLGVGSWLLAEAGYDGQRTLRSIGTNADPSECAALGASLASAPGRRALLVVADGSARRSTKAPGYLDERSADFDEAVRHAVQEGDMDALAAIDPRLARELMAAGRPAWQVLAGALAGRTVAGEILYNDDPLGVAYLVASLRVGGDQRD